MTARSLCGMVWLPEKPPIQTLSLLQPSHAVWTDLSRKETSVGQNIFHPDLAASEVPVGPGQGEPS